MVGFRRGSVFRNLYKRGFWNLSSLIVILVILRLFKGAIIIDIYSFFMSPFMLGIEQKEWLKSSQNIEQKAKIKLLEEDNARLRKVLSLNRVSNDDKIAATVISRKSSGWWQQLELNKGSRDGVKKGDTVVAPGGLVGIINSVSFTTSRVKLITAPGSKVGVWIGRIKHHGVLMGMGTNRPKLSLLNYQEDAQPGDVVSTSPASTIVPPNIPVGVIQYVDKESGLVPFAIIQLNASASVIDWVEVIKNQ